MDPENAIDASKPEPVHATRWQFFRNLSACAKALIFLGIGGVVLLIIIATVAFLYLPRPVPTITLHQGTFEGVLLYRNDFDKAVEGFLGIPYAHPPLGELRFARPRQVFDSNETFQASKYGPRLVPAIS